MAKMMDAMMGKGDHSWIKFMSMEWNSMDTMVYSQRRTILGQRFMVDLIVEIDLKEAGITDDLRGID